MAESTSSLNGTIEDYLLGLADGVAQAQRELDALPESTHRYHLPRVEFELKVIMQLEQAQSGPAMRRDRGRGAPFRLKMRPVAGREVERPELVSAVSTIRGEFVAAPAKQRSLTLRSALVWRQPRAPIVALIATEHGQPAAGVEVNFNVDRERSRSLNASLGSEHSLHGETGFKHVVVSTDADGQAAAELVISASEPAGTIISVVIDAMGQTEQLHVQLGGT